MTAVMHDNPKFVEGVSHRRKIIETFEINLNRCILCGICVDVCAFDAIEMSHEHEFSSYARNGARANLHELLRVGKDYQEQTQWQPVSPDRNVAEIALSKKAEAAKARSGSTETEEGKA